MSFFRMKGCSKKKRLKSIGNGLVGLAVSFLLTEATFAGSYEAPRIEGWNKANVEVRFMHPSRVNEVCQSLQMSDADSFGTATKPYNACAVVKRNTETRQTNCLVYAVQPSNFDDDKRLSVLGHEVWHCMGAFHH
jgi:uncharacterized protein YqiB (DUF1249 family)